MGGKQGRVMSSVVGSAWPIRNVTLQGNGVDIPRRASKAGEEVREGPEDSARATERYSLFTSMCDNEQAGLQAGNVDCRRAGQDLLQAGS